MDNQKKIQSMSTWELAEFLLNVSAGTTKFTVCEEPCESCDKTEGWCISEVGEWLIQEVSESGGGRIQGKG